MRVSLKQLRHAGVEAAITKDGYLCINGTEPWSDEAIAAYEDLATALCMSMRTKDDIGDHIGDYLAFATLKALAR